MLGDREAAEFFSKMATAAYGERERGHTGKKPFTLPPLTAAQVAEVIAAGRDFAYRGDESRCEKR